MKTWRECVTVAALALAAQSAVAAPGPDLSKCQRGIEKESAKLEDAIAKALRYCVNAYRSATVKGESGSALTNEAVACENKLKKAIEFGGSPVSAMDKAYDALRALLGAAPMCTNDMLQALGHMREDLFGDTWARLIVAHAYVHAQQEVFGDARDAAVAFEAFRETAACFECDRLRRGSDCALHTCSLSPSSAACTDTGVLDLPLALSGSLGFFVCRLPQLMSEYVVVGVPSGGIAPVDLGGGTYVCIKTLDADGYISPCSGGTRASLNVESCIDHVVGGAEGANECFPGGGAVCAPDTVDAAHAGTTNGGLCVKSTAGAVQPGAAFLSHTMQITYGFAGQEGVDGMLCTDDDTATPGAPMTLLMTTKTADAVVYDRDTVSGASLPNGPTCPTTPPLVSGTNFDCTGVAASNLSGGKLVAAAPQLHTIFGPPAYDAITTMSLECQ